MMSSVENPARQRESRLPKFVLKALLDVHRHNCSCLGFHDILLNEDVQSERLQSCGWRKWLNNMKTHRNRVLHLESNTP